MATPKRAQESMDSDDDQNGSGSEGTGSNYQLHSRKRARTSTTPSEEDDDVSDLPHLSPLTDDAMPDDDELELRQTQIIQEKYAHLADDANVPSDHGILERVDCYNFMCHDHFSVELGPLINFITGKNGSGKSAILTALTLCLGGKASSTNRGQSLKSFIKEGKENSNIVVRIKNQGDGAYRPEAYGRSIIVERHFNKTTSGFKIKSENGKVISTKKAELDAITDYFSLQIDNPMNVLSQDSARQFLSTSSPAEKYKFFVKGVQLEQLDQDYRLIEESVDQMEEKIRSKSQDIRFLQEQRDAAARRLELCEQDESLRGRIQHLRSQLAWAQVEEQERMRDLKAAELDEKDQEILDGENNLSLFEPRIGAADTEITRAVEGVLRADQRLQDAKDESTSIKERLEKKAQEKTQSMSEQDLIKTELKDAETRLSGARESLAEETRRLAEKSDGGYARRQEEHQQSKDRAASAKQEYESHRALLSDLQANLRRSQDEEKSAKEKYEAKKGDHSQADASLRKLESDNGRRRPFHDKLPALLSAIGREQQSFSEPPVGPVGNYVTLLQPKWSSIVEQCLGAILTSFIVTSKRDQSTLSRIMQRVECELPIIIGKNQHIDTSPHEPDSRFQTVLRVLQIDNSMARTQLIIRHTVEKMLLIENFEEASNVLYDGAPPKNVARCYTINAKDRRKGFHLTYSNGGAPSQTPVGIFDKTPRMKSDAAAQISVRREAVSDLAGQLNDLKQSFELACSKVRRCHQAISDHRQRESDLKAEMQRMEDYTEALQEALDRENVEEGNIDSLQADLKDAEEDKKVHEGSLNDSTAAMSVIENALHDIRQEIEDQERKIRQLSAASQVANEEKTRCEQKRHGIIRDKNHACDQIEKHRQERSGINEALERVKNRVLDFLSQASQISPRIPIDEGETPRSIEQKLEKLQKDLERHHKQLGASRAELATEAEQKENAYVQAKQQIEEHTTIVQQLKTTLDDRKKRWEIFRSHISSRAKAQFTYLLSERSFRGRLLTDHNKKLLDLQVEPDITKDDGSGRGAKTLSGGEKSFSQVCLLLALWEAMGSPIRCLDEFDVYMDPVNRRMAIDLLMGAARRSIGRQFILITPGSKVDIQISPDVKVIELAEPERGQTTLTFQRT